MRIWSAIISLIIVFIIGFGVGNFTKDCDIKYKVDTVNTTVFVPYPEIDTAIYDTIYQPFYKDTGSTKIVENHDTIYRDIDTGAIIRNYFSIRIYNDTFDLDSVSTLHLKETVAMNRIRNRFIDYNRKEISVKPKYYIGVGGFAGYNMAGIKGSFTRKNWEFELGYDLINSGIYIGAEKKFPINNFRFVPF